MKILYLILGLLVISQCQELVLENWVNSNAGFSKAFTSPNYNWSQLLDFAVYGWFKIDPSVVLTNQGVLFHLTGKADGDVSVNQKIGDYVLGVLYKDSVLSVGTYSSPLIPFYNANVSVRSQDIGKWTFFYVGYSGAQKKLFHRFEFNNLGSVYSKWGSITGVQHVLSSYYKLFVGNQNKYSKFPGQISKVHIHAGAGAYRETNFAQIIPENPAIPKCPVIYDQCSFLGNSYTLCDNNVAVPATFPIKSAYLPSGWVLNISLPNGIIGIGGSVSCIGYNTLQSPRTLTVYKNV